MRQADGPSHSTQARHKKTRHEMGGFLDSGRAAARAYLSKLGFSLKTAEMPFFVIVRSARAETRRRTKRLSSGTQNFFC